MKENKLEESVELPQSVNAALEGSTLTIEGPKGKVTRDFTSDNIILTAEGRTVKVASLKGTKNQSKLIGAIVAHIKNTATGVTEGHRKKMKICSGHFPMAVSVSGSEFVVKNFLGEKTPRKLKLKQGVKVEVKGTEVSIEGPDKELVGNTAGSIENLTRRSKFDRRVFQDGIISVPEQ